MTLGQGLKAPCVPDSERTIILQKKLSGGGGEDGGDSGECGGGNGDVGGWISGHATGRRSAYFLDSASEASGATGGKSSYLPQRSFERRTFAASVAAGETPATSRTGGRRVLEGIRDDRQSNFMTQRHRNNTARESKIEEVPTGTQETKPEINGNGGNDAVFYGSIRFPASRIALWNRRPMGSPVAMTPESSAPLLVLRQHAVEHIVSKLDRMAQGSKRGPVELEWFGLVGSVGEVLQGRAADDLRAASAPSQTALEIGGPDLESISLEADGGSSGAGRAGPGRQGSGRSSVEGVMARPVVTVQGVLTAEKMAYTGGEWGETGMRLWRGEVAQAELYSAKFFNGSELYDDPGKPSSTSTCGMHGGSCRAAEDAEETACGKSLKRKLMETYVEASSAARSASLEVFLPLRLYCSLRDAENPRAVPGNDDGEGEVEGWDSEDRVRIRQVPVFLRAEMVVAALGVKLTPIAPIMFLKTAFYQSLLVRGAELKLQSGLLTLNEGRRAVLLSDGDPLALRAPIVGVWVSGTCGGGSSSGEHGPRPSPLRHPHAYAACLRFLLHPGTARGKVAAAGSTVPSSAAFLVLHITGGISGGAPSFFEATATATNGGKAGTGGGRVGGIWMDPGLSFEHLDFSANVEVSIGGGGGGGAGGGRTPSEGVGGRGVGAEGSDGRRAGRRVSSRALVIGRLRRVSNPAFSEPFRKAQESRRSPGVARAHQPEPLPPPVTSTPTRSTPSAEMSSSTRWHIRHQGSSDGGSNAARDGGISMPVSQASARRVSHTPRTLQAKPVANTSSSSPSPRRPSAGDTADLDGVVTGEGVPPFRPLSAMPRSHAPVPPPSTPWMSGYNRATSVQRHPSSGQRLDDGTPGSTFETINGDTWDHVVGPSIIAESAVTPPMNASERRTGGSMLNTPGPDPVRRRQTRHEVVRESDDVVDEEKVSDSNLTPSGQLGVGGDFRFGASPVPWFDDVPGTASAGNQSSRRLSTEASLGRSVFGGPREHLETKPSPSPRASTTSQPPVFPSQGLDLRALDPAARELLLAQQRQLSELEAQLRRLQAEVREADARMSVDRAPSYAPVSVSHTPAVEAPRTQTTEVGLVAATGPMEILSPAPAPVPKPAQTTSVMVDSTTNTSFMWDGEGDEDAHVSPAVPEAEATSDGNRIVNMSRKDELEAKRPSWTSPSLSLLASPKRRTKSKGRRGIDSREIPSERRVGRAVHRGTGDDQAVSRLKDSASKARESISRGSESSESEEAPVSPKRRTKSKGHRGIGSREIPRERHVGRAVHRGTRDDRTASRSKDSAGEVRESIVRASDGSVSEEESFEALRVPGTAGVGRSFSGTSKANNPRDQPEDAPSRRRHRRHTRIAKTVPRRRAANVRDLPIGSGDEKASDSSLDNDAQEEKRSSTDRASRGQGALTAPASGDSTLRPGGRPESDVLGHERSAGGTARGSAGDVRDSREFRESLGVAGRRWATTKLLPVPVTNLVMIPRIEYGNLTDDELISDLDEGETIDRIESKYLKRGALDKDRSSRRR